MSLNETQELTLRRGWRAGTSPQVIATQLGKTVSTVHYHARRLELPQRPRKGLVKNLAVPLTEAQLAAVRKKAHDAGIGMGTMVRGWIEERLK